NSSGLGTRRPASSYGAGILAANISTLRSGQNLRLWICTFLRHGMDTASLQLRPQRSGVIMTTSTKEPLPLEERQREDIRSLVRALARRQDGGLFTAAKPPAPPAPSVYQMGPDSIN